MTGETGRRSMFATPLLRADTGRSRTPRLLSSRIESPGAVEIHLCARPASDAADLETQARSMYINLLRELRGHGAGPEDLVAEKLFLSDGAAQRRKLLEIRDELCGVGQDGPASAVTLLRQPPVAPGQLCEVQAQAILPAEGRRFATRRLAGLPAGASGRVIEADGLRQILLAAVTGDDNASRPHGEALSMFLRADELLQREGFSFGDVVRTWIYITDIDRDYGSLNAARREFFETRRIDPSPASTGIQGSMHITRRRFGLDLRAVAGSGPLRVAPFSAPSLNEAPSYGSDFSRGTRVDLGDRSILYVSGTASIDTQGRVVHVGDIEGQVNRMLLNVEQLLAGQGAGYADLVSAITYLKRGEDRDLFRRVARQRGLPPELPNTLCVADVCRPEWLCEIEATAVLV